MQKEVVSKEVMQELINKLEEIVNNYCWNLESFTDEDINSFFDGTEEEVTYYKSLIVDSIESTSFLWSSKKIAEEIAKAIIESSKYTNSLLKNISSIQLEWCETNLPTTGENNKIYILPVTSESTTVNTLNIWNSTTCEFISIGNLEIDLTNYYTKTETDEKLDLKANADEVISNDKIVQTLDATTNSSDTILSTSGLQTEMDKKANDDEVIKKTDITTTINSTSTDIQVPSAKSVFDSLYELCDTQVLVDANKPTSKMCMADLTTLNTPSKEGVSRAESSLIISIEGRDFWNGQISIAMAEPEVFVRSVREAGAWTKWQRLCSTGVADKSWTTIPESSITNATLVSGGTFTYSIKNGICYVRINGLVLSGKGGVTVPTGTFPIPDISITNGHFPVVSDRNNCYLTILSSSGGLTISCGTNTGTIYTTISYPVKES